MQILIKLKLFLLDLASVFKFENFNWAFSRVLEIYKESSSLWEYAHTNARPNKLSKNIFIVSILFKRAANKYLQQLSVHKARTITLTAVWIVFSLIGNEARQDNNTVSRPSQSNSSYYTKEDPRNIYLYCIKRNNSDFPLSCTTTPAECDAIKWHYGNSAYCRPYACGSTVETIGFTALCKRKGF